MKPLSIMAKQERYIEAFRNLGSSLTVENETLEIMEDFVCEIYGKKAKNNQKMSIDQLRYTIYCQKCGKLP